MIIKFQLQGTDDCSRKEVDLTLDTLKDIDFVTGNTNYLDLEFNFDQSVVDFERIQKTSDRCFGHFVQLLNFQLHSQLDVRAWKVLIGHWYFSFSKALFYRLSVIHRIVATMRPISFELVYDSTVEMSSNQSEDFTEQCLCYDWNEAIFKEIFKITKVFPIEKISTQQVDKQEANKVDIAEPSNNKTLSPRKLFKFFAGLYSRKLFHRSRPVFYFSGLPLLEHIKLFLYSKSLPIWLPPIKRKKHIERKDIRKYLSSKAIKRFSHDSEVDDNFEQVLLGIFFLCIPRNFLEGFLDNENLAKSNLFPARPSYVFMSNGFSIDELSFYIARQISQGTPYIVGQHGGHYGLAKMEMRHTIEEQTADSFITWGHQNSIARNVLPGFNWKKKKIIKKSKLVDNKIIIITRPPFPNLEHYSTVAWYRTYVEDIVRFVKSLPHELQKAVIFRIHPSSSFKNIEKKIWVDQLPDVRFDNSRDLNISDSGNDILVFTYLSTLFYEVLNSSDEIPMCCFWRDIFRDVDEEHKTIIDELKSAKIFFNSAVMASKHLSTVFGTPPRLWSASQRNAVNAFNGALNKQSSSKGLARNLLTLISDASLHRD